MLLPRLNRSTVFAIALLLLWHEPSPAGAPKFDHPKAPTILHGPHVLSSTEPIIVDVRSEPHADRRTVLLELWECDLSDEGDPDMPGQHCTMGPLVRGSVEPADDQKQWTFRFEWESQAEGTYALIARVGATRGLTFSASQWLLIIH